MKPWRAALTSATASGKRIRIASRSARACSSGPPVASTRPRAAAVSSTAVFSVRVANCSRWASATVSACCSANSRRPRMSSSGSPPNGKLKPPSTRSRLPKRNLVSAEHFALQLAGDRGRCLHRLRERRHRPLSECLLEPSGRQADLVQVRRAGQPRRPCHRLVELERGALGLVDSVRVLALAKIGELGPELVELAAAGDLFGQLAERGDRDGGAKAGAI